MPALTFSKGKKSGRLMNQNQPIGVSIPPLKPSQLFLRAILQSAILPLILSPFLFLPAGTLNWLMGWVLLGAYVVGILGTTLLNIWREPELARERFTPKGKPERWDPLLTNLAKILSFVVMLPVAGFDHRFNWSPHSAGWIPVVSLLLFLLAYVLIGWAMGVNKFFSSVVRIQEERGHSTVMSGPYRWIRHPGYLAMIVQFLAAPVALGSQWALIPGGMAAAVYIFRTGIEDRTLQRNLPGYQEYAHQVRYRLFPGIW